MGLTLPQNPPQKQTSEDLSLFLQYSPPSNSKGYSPFVKKHTSLLFINIVNPNITLILAVSKTGTKLEH